MNRSFLAGLPDSSTAAGRLLQNQTDIGKVIGKSGRTITAIRTLLTSAAAKQGKRAMLEIIEPEGRRTEGAPPPDAAQ